MTLRDAVRAQRTAGRVPPRWRVISDDAVMRDPVALQKAPLRAHMRAVRGAMSPAERAVASAAICRRLAQLPELAGVARVLGYCATPHEADISAALRALQQQGIEVVLPWVIDAARLGLTVVDHLERDVAPGWRDVPEPVPAVRRQIAPDAIDVVLAPGLAFDRAGNRLGHGGGHFDRLLSRLRRGAVVVGIAFDQQLVDHVPVAAHDRPVAAVVMPTRTLRATR